jgi:hypothetical protein
MIKDFIYAGFRFKIKNGVAQMYKDKQVVEYINIPTEFRLQNTDYYLKAFTDRHYPGVFLNTTKIKSQS